MKILAKLLAVLVVAGVVLTGCSSGGGEAALPPSGGASADSGKQNAPVSGTGQIVDHGTQRTLKGH